MYIEPVAEEGAPAPVTEMYAADRRTWGFLPTFTRVFSHHPDAYAGWLQLITAVRGNMDTRRCELATLAAAQELRTTYCSVAHGRILRDRFLDAETLMRVAADHRDAGLDEVDVAVMDFATKVARDPTTIEASDVQSLRDHGLDDRDVLDLVLAVAARAFFATVLEALDARADVELTAGLEPELLDALVAVRPPAG